MSIKRVISRQNSIALNRRWAQRGLQHGLPMQPDDIASLPTIDIPIGKVIDSARLYVYHDIYGRINFNCGDDLAEFPNSDFIIDTDNGFLIGKIDDTGGPAFYTPVNMPDGELWNQPLDTTKPIHLKLPYIHVNSEYALSFTQFKFNVGEVKGGGANHARLKITPDVTTGSPNQNNLDFVLDAINYGVVQDTDSCSQLRKYPTYAGTDVGFDLEFWLDETTESAKVKITPDYSGASSTTLIVQFPPGLDYCDQHQFMIDMLPNSTTRVSTAVDFFEILKGTGELNRIKYYLSRDDGANWESIVGDSWLPVGYDNTLLDLSAQGSGTNNLKLKVDLRWPAIIKGLGLAWNEDS